MIDQRRIPWELALVDLYTSAEVAEAIRDMTVRGAPAIGATAAFGMALEAHNSKGASVPAVLADLERAGHQRLVVVIEPVDQTPLMGFFR